MSERSVEEHPPYHHDTVRQEVPSIKDNPDSAPQNTIGLFDFQSRMTEETEDRLSPQSRAVPRPSSQSVTHSMLSPKRRFGVYSMLNPEVVPSSNSSATGGPPSRLPLLSGLSYHAATGHEQQEQSEVLHRSIPPISTLNQGAHDQQHEAGSNLVSEPPLAPVLEGSFRAEPPGRMERLEDRTPRRQEYVDSGNLYPRYSSDNAMVAGYGYTTQPHIEPFRKRSSVTSAPREGRHSVVTESSSPTPSLTPSHGSYAAFTRNIELNRTGPQQTIHFARESFGSSRSNRTRNNSDSHGEQGPYSSESSLLMQEPPAQANMRMMPLTSADGTQFYVPVDVQAASKVADEKRARNAGASARFRERRKMKEREASTAIQKLEQQNRELEKRNKELETQMNFYRSDRDRLRDIVHRTPTISHLASPSQTDGRDPRYAQLTSSSSGQIWDTPRSSGIEIMERPTRRRRLEEHGDYAPFPYIMAQPAIHASRREHESPAVITRLPPITRLDSTPAPAPMHRAYEPPPRSDPYRHSMHREGDDTKRGREAGH